MIGEERAAERLERQQAVVTIGYFDYLFASKGEDHVMPTLGDWLHQWGVGGDMPETDPLAGLKNFERVFGPLEKFHIKRPSEGG